MFCEPAERAASSAEPPISAPKISGVKIVVSKNARDRTRSRYSRMAINQACCSRDRISLGIDLLPHHTHKDFFQ